MIKLYSELYSRAVDPTRKGCHCFRNVCLLFPFFLLSCLCDSNVYKGLFVATCHDLMITSLEYGEDARAVFLKSVPCQSTYPTSSWFNNYEDNKCGEKHIHYFFSKQKQTGYTRIGDVEQLGWLISY